MKAGLKLKLFNKPRLSRLSRQIEFALNQQIDPKVTCGQVSHPVIDNLVKSDIANQVSQYHQSIPEFNPSPLFSLQNLATEIGVKDLWVKDESRRFDLKAFKILGASYAIGKQIQKLALPKTLPLDFKVLKEFARDNVIHVATATDGNHGRAVAWCASQLGCKAHVFMPKGSSQFRLDAINKHAEQAEITDLNYDQTVAMVSKLAAENNWTLIQDTAWQGYQEIPADIKRGYFSLMTEFETQLTNDWPTHIFLQAGVGSMAAAIAAYLVKHQNPTPKIIIVEPDKAPCFFDSMQINDGNAHLYNGDMNTIMAGLACGLPSTTAWEILKSTATGTLKCHDEISKTGMRRYAAPMDADPAIISGESAAVTLGSLESIMTRAEFQDIQQALLLDNQSKILLFSTEGDTDPQMYQSIVTDTP